MIPFIVGLTLINSVERLKQLGWVLMLSQGMVALEMNLAYYGGYNKIAVGSFGALDNNSQAISMVCGVGLAFFLGIGATQWWQRLLSWFVAILMAHAVMLSGSRGGMLALIVSIAMGFMLLPPKKPKHLLAFLVVVVILGRLAGPSVQDRFMSAFVDPQERDRSAESRLDLWADNWDVMVHNPVLGVGPDHWPLIAQQYGWKPGKEGHSLWFQTGAELGFPGLGFLMLFYGLTMVRLWPIARNKGDVQDPWLRDVARMVIASQMGFVVAAQFVSLEGLEIPYFITLLGAGALKLLPQEQPVPKRVLEAPPVGSADLSLHLRRT